MREPNLSLRDPHNPDQLDPVQYAAIARALLWSVTVLTPGGATPGIVSPPVKKMFADAVAQTGPLIRDIERNPEKEILYRSSLRDISIALRIILLNDAGYLTSDQDMQRFFEAITRAWNFGKGANLELYNFQ
jgi:hypothetical protein